MKRDLFIMSEEALDILYRAANRRLGSDIAYAGAVTPKEAFRLHTLGAAKLIDVRTRAEWDYVGRVPDSTLIEWRAYGAQDPNPDFIEQLRAVAGPTDVVMFLCRSGVRGRRRRVHVGAEHPRGVRGRPGRRPAPRARRRVAGGGAAVGAVVNVNS